MKKILVSVLSIFLLSSIFLMSIFISPISAKSNEFSLYAKLGVNEKMPYDAEMGFLLSQETVYNENEIVVYKDYVKASGETAATFHQTGEVYMVINGNMTRSLQFRVYGNFFWNAAENKIRFENPMGKILYNHNNMWQITNERTWESSGWDYNNVLNKAVNYNFTRTYQTVTVNQQISVRVDSKGNRLSSDIIIQ